MWVIAAACTREGDIAGHKLSSKDWGHVRNEESVDPWLLLLALWPARRQAVKRVVEMLQLPAKDPLVGNHYGRR